MPEWEELTDPEHNAQWIFGTMVLSLLAFWIITEILERKCGMAPRIYTSQKINELAHIVEQEYEESVKRKEAEYSIEIPSDAHLFDEPSLHSASASIHQLNQMTSTSITADPNYNENSSSGKSGDVEMGAAGGSWKYNKTVETVPSDQKQNQNENETISQQTTQTNDVEDMLAEVPKPDSSSNINNEKQTTQPPVVLQKTKSQAEVLDRAVTTDALAGDSSSMLHRLTKKMDIEGNYRVTIRSSVTVIRIIIYIIINVVSLWSIIRYPQAWVDHIWLQKHETVQFLPLRVCYLIIMSFYLWELSVNRYGHLSYSQIAHHLMATLTVSRAIAFNEYTPTATVFGFLGVSFGYILQTALLLRYLTPKMPWLLARANIVRFMFAFAFYWYLFWTFGMNISFQILVFVRGIITGQLNTWQLSFMCVAICVWMYEDFQILKILKQYSEHHYEIAELLQIKSSVDHVKGHVKLPSKAKQKKKDKKDKKGKKNEK